MSDREKFAKLLTYNARTGVLRWRRRIGRKGKAKWGGIAGSIDCNGHRIIGVDGKKYRACRIAWLLKTGEWPNGLIDHENKRPGDDRFANLREATQSTNMANRKAPTNNTSGRKGVCWDKSRGRWSAKITVRYKTINLGRFDEIDDAAAAYDSAARKYFKEFAST